MTALATLLAPLSLVVVAAALGAALLLLAGPRAGGAGAAGADGGAPRHRPDPAGDPAGTAATALTAGVVLLFLLLLALDGLGIPWRRVSLAAGSLAAFALLAGAAAWRATRGGALPHLPGIGGLPRPVAGLRNHWGDLLAALAVAAFAAAAWTLHATIPDFIYHWGVKGKRFQVAGGVDLAYLADPLGPVPHPDYPHLLPSLYAATAHVRGFFDERSMMLWSVLAVALLAAFAHSALVRGLGGGNGDRRIWVQGGTALVTLVAAMFAVGYDLAGGGEPIIALALVAALPALVRTGATVAEGGLGRAGLHRDDLRVGVAAALAAATKIEGVPLAGLLILGRLLATRGAGGGALAPVSPAALVALARRLPRLVLPALAVVVPWLVGAVHHGLLGGRSSGALELDRLATVAPAALRVLAMPEWYGFPWLLALLPWLLASRRLRIAALVVAAQGAFYLGVYLTAAGDVRFYVLSSLPRLLYHPLPAFLALLVLRLATGPRDR